MGDYLANPAAKGQSPTEEMVDREVVALAMRVSSACSSSPPADSCAGTSGLPPAAPRRRHLRVHRLRRWIASIEKRLLSSTVMGWSAKRIDPTVIFVNAIIAIVR